MPVWQGIKQLTQGVDSWVNVEVLFIAWAFLLRQSEDPQPGKLTWV